MGVKAGRVGLNRGNFLDWNGADLVPRPTAPVPIEPQICQATCAVMKLSFDEEYRRAMNELGECTLPSSVSPPFGMGLLGLIQPTAGFQP